MAKALIVYGGWDGHEPEQISLRFKSILEKKGIEVELSDKISVLDEADKLKTLDLIVPVWTMGEISEDQCRNVSEAVAEGTGLAGCHGGMCDAFRQSVLWQFMTGANWVAHPGGDGVEYTVNMIDSSNPLVEGIEDFQVKSEHYYLHVDPANTVLATTRFPLVDWYHSTNGAVEMPVVWTRKWGLGRVFYNSLGHHNDVFDVPEAEELMARGLFWAAGSRKYALDNKLSVDKYRSKIQMF